MVPFHFLKYINGVRMKFACIILLFFHFFTNAMDNQEQNLFQTCHAVPHEIWWMLDDLEADILNFLSCCKGLKEAGFLEAYKKIRSKNLDQKAKRHVVRYIKHLQTNENNSPLISGSDTISSLLIDEINEKITYWYYAIKADLKEYLKIVNYCRLNSDNVLSTNQIEFQRWPLKNSIKNEIERSLPFNAKDVLRGGKAVAILWNKETESGMPYTVLSASMNNIQQYVESLQGSSVCLVRIILPCQLCFKDMLKLYCQKHLDFSKLPSPSDISYTDGSTLFHYIAYRGRDTLDDDVELMRKFLKKEQNKRDIIENTNDVGNTLLHSAVRNGKVDLMQFLLSIKESVYSVKKYGVDLLGISLDNRRRDTLVPLLVTHGADINKPDKDRNTALHVAVRKTYPFLVRYFLEHGADCMSENNEKDIPLFCMVRRDDVVALKKYQETLGHFLDFGFNINTQNTTGDTLLHIMVRNGHDTELFALLLDHGIAVNIKNNDDQTVIDLAKVNKTSGGDFCLILKERGLLLSDE